MLFDDSAAGTQFSTYGTISQSVKGLFVHGVRDGQSQRYVKYMTNNAVLGINMLSADTFSPCAF